MFLFKIIRRKVMTFLVSSGRGVVGLKGEAMLNMGREKLMEGVRRRVGLESWVVRCELGKM